MSPWWQLRGASSSSVLVTLRLPQGLCDVPAARAEVAPGALHSPALAAAAARADPAPPPLQRGAAGPALPRASSGLAQRPARGGAAASCRSLLPAPAPVATRAASGRTRVGRGGLGSVGAYRPQAGPRRHRSGAAGSEAGLGGWGGLRRAGPGGRGGAQV